MGLNKPRLPPHSIAADQNVTRRKWYHVVTAEGGEAVFAARRIEDCLEVFTSAGKDEALLKLPNGQIWRMSRLGEARKEP